VPWTVGVPNVSPHKGRKRRINNQKGKTVRRNTTKYEGIKNTEKKYAWK
jgi:hypothetical protein